MKNFCSNLCTTDTRQSSNKEGRREERWVEKLPRKNTTTPGFIQTKIKARGGFGKLHTYVCSAGCALECPFCVGYTTTVFIMWTARYVESHFFIGYHTITAGEIQTDTSVAEKRRQVQSLHVQFFWDRQHIAHDTDTLLVACSLQPGTRSCTPLVFDCGNYG